MTDYSVAGEGVTKRTPSGPFGTFCYHVVTKRTGVTKNAGSASNLTCHHGDRTCCGDKMCRNTFSLSASCMKTSETCT